MLRDFPSKQSRATAQAPDGDGWTDTDELVRKIPWACTNQLAELCAFHHRTSSPLNTMRNLTLPPQLVVLSTAIPIVCCAALCRPSPFSASCCCATGNRFDAGGRTLKRSSVWSWGLGWGQVGGQGSGLHPRDAHRAQALVRFGLVPSEVHPGGPGTCSGSGLSQKHLARARWRDHRPSLRGWARTLQRLHLRPAETSHIGAWADLEPSKIDHQ